MSEAIKPVERPYTLKPLDATAIAPMGKIISKIGVHNFTECFGKESVLNVIKSGNKESMSDLAGLQVIAEMTNVILSRLPDCETECFEFLAHVSDLKINEIKKLGLSMTTRMIIDIMKDKEFKDFIGVVSELFN